MLARLRGCVEAAVGAPSERLLLPCVLLASALRAGSVLDRALAEVARLIPEVPQRLGPSSIRSHGLSSSRKENCVRTGDQFCIMSDMDDIRKHSNTTEYI